MKDKEFTHSHKCPDPKCGCIWAHTAKAHGRDEYHHCPECGRVQWDLYDGIEEPSVVQEVAKKRK